PPDLVSAGRLGLLDLFDYVMRHVVDEAELLRATQTPILYGSVTGSPRLAVSSKLQHTGTCSHYLVTNNANHQPAPDTGGQRLRSIDWEIGACRCPDRFRQDDGW